MLLSNFFNSRWKNYYRDVKFGANTQLIGRQYIKIGLGTCIGENCWLNVCYRDGSNQMQIGRKVLIGRGSLLSTGGTLEIADYSLLGPYCCIADADHIFSDPMQPVLQQGVTAGRSIIIEENCWLGFGVKILGNVTIGRGSVIGAGSIVRQDIPPFSVVVGSPACVVKQFNFLTNKWESTTDEDSKSQLQKSRQTLQPPTREKYLETLNKNDHTSSLGAELAGSIDI